MVRPVNARRLLVGLTLLNVALLPAASALGAFAHVKSDFYGGSNTWAVNADVGYKIDDSFTPALTNGAVTTADGRWSNRVNGRAPDFNYNGAASVGNPFTACDGPNVVFRDYMGPENGFPDGVLAFTPTCRPSGNVTGFSMIINSRYAFSLSTEPSDPGELDLLAVLVHEFGHATGWTGHYGANTDQCSGTGPDQTMCPNYEPTEPNEWRTLEEHDTHTLQNAYQ